MIASLTAASPTSFTLATAPGVALAADERWHGGYGGGFFLLGPLFALFWIVLAVLAVRFFLARSGRGPSAGWGGWGGSAESVLRERYARGEVDAEEYQARLEVLRASSRRR